MLKYLFMLGLILPATCFAQFMPTDEDDLKVIHAEYGSIGSGTAKIDEGKNILNRCAMRAIFQYLDQTNNGISIRNLSVNQDQYHDSDVTKSLVSVPFYLEGNLNIANIKKPIAFQGNAKVTFIPVFRKDLDLKEIYDSTACFVSDDTHWETPSDSYRVINLSLKSNKDAMIMTDGQYGDLTSVRE